MKSKPAGLRALPPKELRVLTDQADTATTALLSSRLHRAALNQSDLATLSENLGSELQDRHAATFSRYGIWAQTAANLVQDATKKISSDQDNAEALKLLSNVEASLKAFVRLQEEFVGWQIRDG